MSTPVPSSISWPPQNIVDSSNVSIVKIVQRIDRVSGVVSEVSNLEINRKSVNSNTTSNTNIEFNLRRNGITDGVKNQLIRYSNKGLVIDKVDSFDKI